MNENSAAEYNKHIPEAQLKLKKAHRTKGTKGPHREGASQNKRSSLTKHNNKVSMQWYKGDKDSML